MSPDFIEFGRSKDGALGARKRWDIADWFLNQCNWATNEAGVHQSPVWGGHGLHAD